MPAVRVLLMLFTLLVLSPAHADAPMLVRAAPLAELTLQPQRSAPATVLTLNDSRLSAEVQGRVLRIAVNVGDEVSVGAVLAELDCRDHQLALAQARAEAERADAQRALARRQLDRARSLAEQRNISEELLQQRETELVAAATALELAQVVIQQAELRIQRCTVRAPFDGVVTARLAQVGELATPGTAMVQLVDRRRLEVSAQVPVDALASLQSAQEVWLEAETERAALTLARITPVVNSAARTREVRLRFAAEAVLPGAAGRLVWRAAAPHVPANLLVARNGTLGVFVVNDGRAHFVAVPQAQEGQPAPVDLPPNTLVVTEGRYGLRDGAAVDVRP